MMLAVLLSKKSDANIVLRDAQWPARAGAPLLPQDPSFKTCPQRLLCKPRGKLYDSGKRATITVQQRPKLIVPHLQGVSLVSGSETTGGP